MELYGYDSFEQMIADNCAPVLMGAKAGNLICMEIKYFQEIEAELIKYNALFNENDIFFHSICYCDKRVLILVYNKSRLCSILADKGYRAYLIACGYNAEANLEQDLKTLETHLKERREFSHEIGVFLGYPLEDVLGFVINKGEGSKYVGCWKVYGNVRNAKILFSMYEYYRKTIINKLSQGMSLKKAVTEF